MGEAVDSGMEMKSKVLLVKAMKLCGDTEV